MTFHTDQEIDQFLGYGHQSSSRRTGTQCAVPYANVRFADEEAMTLAGIDAVHQRLEAITNRIAAIEGQVHSRVGGPSQSTHQVNTASAQGARFQRSLATYQHTNPAVSPNTTASITPAPVLGQSLGPAVGGGKAGLAASALQTLSNGGGGVAGLTGMTGALNGSPTAIGVGTAGGGSGIGGLGGAAPQLASVVASEATSTIGIAPGARFPGAVSPGAGVPGAGAHGALSNGALLHGVNGSAAMPFAGHEMVAQTYGVVPAQGTSQGGLDDPLVRQLANAPIGTHPQPPAKRDQKVPADLAPLGNGKLPSYVLESVGVKDHQLWSPAAKAFKALRAAAQRDGVQIGVNSSYRDVACQQCMVDKYGRFDQGGRAAPPGKSNHGWGLSIDLQLDAKAKAWMKANGRNYGFVNDVAREPWHWTFIADTPPTLAAG